MQNKIVAPIIILFSFVVFGFFAYQYFWLPNKTINESVDVTPTEEIIQDEETTQEEDEEIVQEEKVVEEWREIWNSFTQMQNDIAKLLGR